VNSVLIYIDEEPRARSLYSRRLGRAVGDEVTVVAVEPDETLHEMLDKVEQNCDVVSIVIDQNLFANGVAQYLGTQLAEKLRLSDSLMPIYILTNHAEAVDPYIGSIEYVISKGSLEDQVKLDAIGARMRRHINIFKQILLEREVRFEQLLRKQFDSGLDESELTEFAVLKYGRERKDMAVNGLASSEVSKKLDEAEELIRAIEVRLGRGS